MIDLPCFDAGNQTPSMILARNVLSSRLAGDADQHT
jgi:hypothetical protein